MGRPFVTTLSLSLSLMAGIAYNTPTKPCLHTCMTTENPPQPPQDILAKLRAAKAGGAARKAPKGSTKKQGAQALPAAATPVSQPTASCDLFVTAGNAAVTV
jgi:hypothetical protein